MRETIEAAFPQILADLERLVRFAGVSADPAAEKAVQHSAEAVVGLAQDAGAERVQILSVPGGQPAVVAHWPAPAGAPTVLLYAHHDVQPPGRREDWSSDPFEPTERDGRLYGRGTADDKAGVLAHIAAVRAFDGRPPVGVTLFVEGEEEIGSPTFATFLEEYKDDLEADVIVVADSMNWSVDTPALTTSLRGLVDCVVEVRVLERAVHSGIFGGPVLDAVSVLSRLLATLHDENGDVAVAGLQAGTAGEVTYPEERYRAEAGVLEGVDLAGTGSLADRLWMKPTVSVVGLDAPSVAEAANVLVHEARAKISMRLAPGQDPREALDALRAHMAERVEFGAQVTVVDGALASAWVLDTTSSAFTAAEAALTQAFDRQPVRIGLGGSIPFIAELERAFPAATVLVTGVEDPDSGAHGVDESLHLEQFTNVCLAEALLLQRLASQPV